MVLSLIVTYNSNSNTIIESNTSITNKRTLKKSRGSGKNFTYLNSYDIHNICNYTNGYNDFLIIQIRKMSHRG